MSTSKAKKTVPKPSTPTARYKTENKVYYLFSTGQGHEEILEGEVSEVNSSTTPVKNEVGKTIGSTVSFKYGIETRRGHFDVPEYALYPNFTKAAEAFAAPYLTLIK